MFLADYRTIAMIYGQFQFYYIAQKLIRA